MRLLNVTLLSCVLSLPSVSSVKAERPVPVVVKAKSWGSLAGAVTFSIVIDALRTFVYVQTTSSSGSIVIWFGPRLVPVASASPDAVKTCCGPVPERFTHE